MNWNRKAVFKSGLVLLLAGTLAGCGSKEETKQDPDPEVKDQEEVKEPEQATEVMDKDIPTITMSPEDTSVLAEGLFLEKDILMAIGLPDDLTLENNGKSFVYVYTYLPNENTSGKSVFKFGTPLSQYLKRYGEFLGNEGYENASNYRFDGIEIFLIDGYIFDEDSKWYKLVLIDEKETVTTTPVLSEEKIKELEAGEK